MYIFLIFCHSYYTSSNKASFLLRLTHLYTFWKLQICSFFLKKELSNDNIDWREPEIEGCPPLFSKDNIQYSPPLTISTIFVPAEGSFLKYWLAYNNKCQSCHRQAKLYVKVTGSCIAKKQNVRETKEFVWETPSSIQEDKNWRELSIKTLHLTLWNEDSHRK